MIPMNLRRHTLALAIGAGLVLPLLGLGLLAGGGVPEGRVLALAPPWRADAEVIARLGAAGATALAPLALPGAWLAVMAPGDETAAGAGALLLPLDGAWAFVVGCAPARSRG